MEELKRFILAQDSPYAGYDQALSEIKAGQKESHWMWYIFPQIHGMGRSPMSQMYAIRSLDEARAYLADELLGGRLREITGEVLKHRGRRIEEIMGSGIDAKKLRSCMTLFDAVSPGDVFSDVLETFYDGKRDPMTLRILSAESSV